MAVDRTGDDRPASNGPERSGGWPRARLSWLPRGMGACAQGKKTSWPLRMAIEPSFSSDVPRSDMPHRDRSGRKGWQTHGIRQQASHGVDRLETAQRSIMSPTNAKIPIFAIRFALMRRASRPRTMDETLCSFEYAGDEVLSSPPAQLRRQFDLSNCFQFEDQRIVPRAPGLPNSSKVSRLTPCGTKNPPHKFQSLGKAASHLFRRSARPLPRKLPIAGGAHKLGTSPPETHQLALKTLSAFGAYSCPRIPLVFAQLLPFSPSSGSLEHAYKRPFAASDFIHQTAERDCHEAGKGLCRKPTISARGG